MTLAITGIICFIVGYISYSAWALTGFGSAIIFQISCTFSLTTPMSFTLQQFLTNTCFIMWCVLLGYFISLFYGNGDIVDGLLYLSIAGVVVNPYQAFLLHKYVYWKMVFIMLVGFVPFMIVGIQVLLYVNSPWLKRSLGMLFLLQWFKMLYDQKQHEKKARNEHSQVPPIISNNNNTTTSSQEEICNIEQMNSISKKNGEDELLAVVIEKNNVTLIDDTKATISKFEINGYKDVSILLVVSSFAGFLGGLFGTAGKKNFMFSASFSFLHKLSKQLTFA